MGNFWFILRKKPLEVFMDCAQNHKPETLVHLKYDESEWDSI